MNILESSVKDDVFRKELKEEIKSFNNEVSPHHKAVRDEKMIKYYSLKVVDEGIVVGGLTTSIYWNSMKLDDFFIKAEYRGKHLGEILLTKAIQHAKELELMFVWLETFSFQARGFYEGYGFEVVGELNDYPPGNSLYTMKLSMNYSK